MSKSVVIDQEVQRRFENALGGKAKFDTGLVLGLTPPCLPFCLWLPFPLLTGPICARAGQIDGSRIFVLGTIPTPPLENDPAPNQWYNALP